MSSHCFGGVFDSVMLTETRSAQATLMSSHCFSGVFDSVMLTATRVRHKQR